MIEMKAMIGGDEATVIDQNVTRRIEDPKEVVLTGECLSWTKNELGGTVVGDAAKVELAVTSGVRLSLLVGHGVNSPELA
jgi:hypothetical protein